jgi:hypothetical protein
MSMTQLQSAVERWGIFEVALAAAMQGNPFTDVTFSARFSYRHRTVDVDGFYDGDGVFRARFMPDQEGEWSYVTRSNVAALDGQGGRFTCVAPAPGIHGPVYVANRHHFAYADGTPYVPVGTTCYVWNHQGDELEERTLATLKTAPFNKMRMCAFPKHYDYNHNEPPLHPFEGSGPGAWDFTRFNPAYFRQLERRIADLGALGIEADLILFHPYDRWGYSTMGRAVNERYLRYLVARLAAHRNVWWSFANEYDLMPDVPMADWDRYFQLVQECDPAQHLRSIHNCRSFYDHGKPWVTHCSVQSSDVHKVAEWRAMYGKPVVVDECCYEGNINHGWGNITAQEMAHRFWKGFARGGYVGHGETYMHPEDILWWSKGGVLHGESPARIAFLRRIVEEAPAGLDPIDMHWDVACAGQVGEYYLMYFGNRQPTFRDMILPDDRAFTIDLIDTWGMAIQRLTGTYRGTFRLPLPGKPFMALRICKA